MTRVAFFLTDLGGGGAERVMLNLANGFCQKGFDVDVVLVNLTGPYLSKLDKRVNVIACQRDRLLACVPELVKYLRAVRPEVLITALEDTNLVAIAAHRLARVNTRLMVTVHNNLTQEARHLKTLKRRLVPYLIRWVYPLADDVVAVSQGVAADLRRLGIPAKKIEVIYNPIITPDFQALAAEQPDHSWFQDGGTPVVLGVGRLTPQKDFETLLRAFAQLRERRLCRLMILGVGEDHEMLLVLRSHLGLDEQTVTFPGFVDNPFAYMAQSAMCVLSSAWEGFGNVLVESMGAGTPVVSTDCPSGPAEILAEGTYGPLVPVGDDVALSAAMDKALTAPMSAAVLRQRAMDFSLERVLAAYIRVLFDAQRVADLQVPVSASGTRRL